MSNAIPSNYDFSKMKPPVPHRHHRRSSAVPVSNPTDTTKDSSLESLRASSRNGMIVKTINKPKPKLMNIAPASETPEVKMSNNLHNGFRDGFPDIKIDLRETRNKT